MADRGHPGIKARFGPGLWRGRRKVPRRASPAIRRRAVALRSLPGIGSKGKATVAERDVRFCCDAKSLESESIDAVSSIAVWMTLSSHQACLQYLAEQHRLLRRDGRAFIVVTHPCFREESTRPSRPNSRTRATCRMVSLSRSRSSTVTRLSSSLTSTGTYQPCLSSRARLDFGCLR